jgi:hypothetical protein
VFISVRGVFACCLDKFEYGVDSETGVREDGCAFVVYEGEGEVGWVDTAGEKECVVVVDGFVEND